MKIIEMIAGSKGMGDAKSMAEMLRRMGRRGDTMLAHITPEEADMLMEAGGAGTTNPDTGLPEFYNPYDYNAPDMGEPPDLTVQEYNRMTAAPPAAMGRDFQRDQATDFDAGRSSYQGVDYGTDIFAPRQAARESTAFQPSYPNVGRSTEFEQIPQLRQPVSSFSRYEPVEPPTDIFSRFEPLQDRTAELAPPERGLAERAEAGIQELRDLLDRYPNLTRGGTAAASILAQALMFNRANQAMKRDIEDTRRAADPFRQAQEEAMSRATGGGLTPEQEQELETSQARARQGLSERGMQTGSAASGILAAQQRRARSLARQESFQEALRLANIADQYDRRALEMELQRDQQLGQLFASILGREVQQAQRTEAPVPSNQVQQAR
jgi:hypothetical protein